MIGTDKRPENVVILCKTDGEILLKKDQASIFYDPKNKIAGLCPLCHSVPRAIYSCNRVNDYPRESR